ncbi:MULTISPECIES: flagellin [Ramlibacter]|uniref:Flagellin n=1 Tax=Ramlibacter aquaticus TaxID=2780094 RepID=A0ABR9SA24_9BURK|nr:MULTISPECIES: flagellin [Ramlibacter]MBE7939205.1 flagellin [Ramlibacter aquaticus]
MSSIINTNLASLNTQRNLSTSQSSLNVSIQRLSSGLRINSAKDDAAGLAIAERMNAQVRGLTVAARNGNDGVSLAQTAEGALGKIGDMVQRMRELAVQASNATNSASDKQALQGEVTQLKSEIDRVSQSTSFNGTRLLDGSFTAASFQVGSNAGDTITVGQIADARLQTLGGVQTTSTVGSAVTSTTTGLDLTSAELTITYGSGSTQKIEVGAASSASERQAQIVDAVNASSSTTGVTASFDSTTNKVTLSSAQSAGVTGTTFSVQQTGSGTGTTGFTTTAATSGTFVNSAMDSLDVSKDPMSAIKQCDEALNTINGARANLGALQSRFESAVSNIQIASENTTAARSRIMDTDYAAETANLSRSQILQQAGNAMLAQANQLPQQVLALLR